MESLSTFPPHRRRHLKSDTLSTFLRILSLPSSLPAHPELGSDNNELGRTTEVGVEVDNVEASRTEVVNVAESANENRMETNKLDLGDNVHKDIDLGKGMASNKLEQTSEVCGDADDTIILESEILSTNGDASCLKVTNVDEPVHDDRIETTNMEPEILSTHGDSPCLKVTNMAESVHKDRMETTNMEPEILLTNNDASCSIITNVAESVLENRTEITNMEPEILSIDGDAPCPKVTNVIESFSKDRMETTNMELEIFSSNGDASCSKVTNVTESGNEDRMETDEVHRGNSLSKELGEENGLEIMNFPGERSPGSSIVSLTTINEPQNSLVGSFLKDSEMVTHEHTNMEDQACKLTEGFHLSVDMDELTKSPIFDGNEEVRRLFMESSELPQVNLENSLSKSGSMSSLCAMMDKEVEEGEISMDFVIDDDFSFDSLFEEAQTSTPIENEAHISNQNEEGPNEVENKYDDKDIGVTVDEAGKGVETNLGTSDMSDIELKYGTMIQDMLRNQKQADVVNDEFHHSDVSGKITAPSATTNQGDLFIDMDDGVQKKRKRGPMTLEKKAKKKKKERIKRAEKNRQLGVKRLKIQPMVKPKTIQICRHYLKGRCQEGDKCKFSHDATPLTKSKPCCHFARNSCMKGDDCPYDHQLSKYPCNNFVTNGFCSRGNECLFSHEAQHKEGSPSSVNASNAEVKESLSLSRAMNLEKKMSLLNPSNQKVDAKSGSSVISSKNAEQKIADNKLRAVSPAPKGISKLLFGKSSLDTENKLVHAGISSKADGNANVNLSMINSTQNMVANLLGTSKVASHAEQKGLNFLSFGKATNEIHMDKEKLATSASKQAESLKFVTQIGESKRDLAPNSSETPKKTPSMPPRGINFLSFGKSPVDNSNNTMIATPNTDNGASSSANASQLSKGTPSSSLKSLLSNGPSSAQKALQSTLAFAAKFESRIKIS